MNVRDNILAVSPHDRAQWKCDHYWRQVNKPIARQKIGSRLDVEIVQMRRTRNGIVAFARAWRNGKQLGFGADGSVDIERFRIINPPLLIDDPTGDIIVPVVDDETGLQTGTRILRYAPKQALLSTLKDTIKTVAKHGNAIVPDRVGNTTTTVYSHTADGSVRASVSEQTWASIIAHAGSNVTDDASASGYFLRFRSGTVTDRYDLLYRGVLPFDTSAIGTDTVSSATLSVYVQSTGNNLSGESSANSAMVVTDCSPADPTSLVAGDFDSGGSTEFGRTGNQAGLSEVAYTDIALNASGRSAINGSGYTSLMGRYGWDFDELEPGSNGITWSATNQMRVNIYYADNAGTTNDPKLVIEHAAATAFRPKVIMY